MNSTMASSSCADRRMDEAPDTVCCDSAVQIDSWKDAMDGQDDFRCNQ